MDIDKDKLRMKKILRAKQMKALEARKLKKELQKRKAGSGRPDDPPNSQRSRSKEDLKADQREKIAKKLRAKEIERLKLLKQKAFQAAIKPTQKTQTSETPNRVSVLQMREDQKEEVLKKDLELEDLRTKLRAQVETTKLLRDEKTQLQEDLRQLREDMGAGMDVPNDYWKFLFEVTDLEKQAREMDNQVLILQNQRITAENQESKVPFDVKLKLVYQENLSLKQLIRQLVDEHFRSREDWSLKSARSTQQLSNSLADLQNQLDRQEEAYDCLLAQKNRPLLDEVADLEASVSQAKKSQELAEEKAELLMVENELQLQRIESLEGLVTKLVMESHVPDSGISKPNSQIDPIVSPSDQQSSDFVLDMFDEAADLHPFFDTMQARILLEASQTSCQILKHLWVTYRMSLFYQLALHEAGLKSSYLLEIGLAAAHALDNPVDLPDSEVESLSLLVRRAFHHFLRFDQIDEDQLQGGTLLINPDVPAGDVSSLAMDLLVWEVLLLADRQGLGLPQVNLLKVQCRKVWSSELLNSSLYTETSRRYPRVLYDKLVDALAQGEIREDVLDELLYGDPILEPRSLPNPQADKDTQVDDEDTQGLSDPDFGCPPAEPVKNPCIRRDSRMMNELSELTKDIQFKAGFIEELILKNQQLTMEKADLQSKISLSLLENKNKNLRLQALEKSEANAEKLGMAYKDVAIWEGVCAKLQKHMYDAEVLSL